MLKTYRDNLMVNEILLLWDIYMHCNILTASCILQYEFKLEVIMSIKNASSIVWVGLGMSSMLK